MSNGAEYDFVPWVRDGYQPEEGDDASLHVELTVEGDGTDGSERRAVGVDLSLYGPGEVTGLDRRQVVRTEPTPGTSDFPPNRFPLVEFDRPDLPWLFSPSAADSNGQLRPWLCLIVVPQTEGVTLSTKPDDGGATLTLADPASPADHLPDPTESWAWAHAQVVGHDDVGGELEADRSEKTLSRVLSPRDLDPQTDYYACVVPTYEAGRLAGLGSDPVERDDDGDSVRVTGDAWNLDESPSRLRLPVYYHWEFSTGKAGDFEALVRRLDPTVLEDVGVRQVDAGDPGPDVLENAGDVVSVEGALRSFDILSDGYERQDELAELVDEASALAPETAVSLEDLTGGDGSDAGDGDDGADGATRVLGPPIYGQWPPASEGISDDVDSPAWLRELNADPRFRVPAAFGTDVIQDQQEQLMAEAWRQVGDVREANKLLRRARLARGASQGIHDAMDDLAPAALVSLTEPAHRRTIDEDAGRTVAAAVEDSALPSALLSPAFRRITRPTGPLARRLGGVTRERVVERVNDGTIDPGDDGEAPDGTNVLEADLAEQICASANEAVGDRTDWEFFGTANEGDLEDAVDRIRELCHDARKRARATMHALADENEDLASVVGQLLEVLYPICGDYDGTVLDELADAIDEGDWAAVQGTLMELDRWLSAADDRHETLRDEADFDAGDRLATLLERDPALSPAVEAFLSGVFHLRVRLIVEQLFAIACHNGRHALDQMDKPNRRTPRSVGEVRDLCAVLCGVDADEGGLLGQLQEAAKRGSPRDIRSIVDAMAQVIAIAKPRLQQLNQRDVPGVHDLRSACEGIERYVRKLRKRLGDAPFDPVGTAIGSSVCRQPTTDTGDPLDLTATAEAVLEATDPATTIPARIAARLDGIAIEDRDDPLVQIMAHPEFDQPMYADLRDRSQEALVPGVGDIPLDSVGTLETNPAFVESYMIGLSHEMARELRWREYPTDLRGTYFRQFWDPEGRDSDLEPEEKSDIDYVHKWNRELNLGGNYLDWMDEKRQDDENGDVAGGRVVLVVRGTLFDRYPNTHVYAAKGIDADDATLERQPDLPDPAAGTDGKVEHPIFRGQLDPDVTFFGFELDESDVLADPDDDEDHGWFFVIEEPPSEPSFGLDVPVERDEADDWTWEDLTWEDVTADGYVAVEGADPDGEDVPDDLPDDHDWGKNGAHMGAITWIRPFRAAIHADDMIPIDGGQT